MGLEDEAHTLHCYSALVLHGLLQTEEYAHEVFAGALPLSPGAIRHRVQVRMRRQARLSGPEPLEFRAVIDEAAIRRRVGGPEIMRAQIHHLLELAEKPNIRIQVIPFEAGAHPATSGPFILLKMPYPGADIVHIELMDKATYVEEDVDVHRYSLAFDQLRSRAIPVADTPAYLRRVIAEI